MEFSKYETVELQKIRIGLELLIQKDFLLDPSTDIEDYLSNLVRIRLQGYLWGESGQSTTIKYPVDWWQAFKEEWFPVWALKRWPVRYRVHTINTTTLYPKFNISLPRHEHTLRYVINTGIKLDDWRME